MKIALLVCACVLLCACPAAGPLQPQLKLQHLPPTPKDVIAVVLEASQLPLSDASCKGSGTEADDKTIGRYLAGYLAELSTQDARNAITTTVERSTEGGESFYVCRLMVRHAQGEDIWSWGVQFKAGQSNGVVSPRSMQCIGAG